MDWGREVGSSIFKKIRTARQFFLVTFSMLAFPAWHLGELLRNPPV